MPRHTTVGARELKIRLGGYLQRVRQGHTLVITDRGHPVAELRPLERAGMLSAFRDKKLKGLVFTISGIHGNAATRIEAFAATGGVYAYGAYPDIDGLFRDQAGEQDPKKREALVHKIQQLIHDKVMFLPIWQLSVLTGYGPRVAEPGLGLIADYPWSAPYEDVKLKGK